MTEYNDKIRRKRGKYEEISLYLCYIICIFL